MARRCRRRKNGRRSRRTVIQTTELFLATAASGLRCALVIARSEATKQSSSSSGGGFWIASLRSQWRQGFLLRLLILPPRPHPDVGEYFGQHGLDLAHGHADLDPWVVRIIQVLQLPPWR